MWHMREGGGGKTSKAVRFQVLWEKKSHDSGDCGSVHVSLESALTRRHV